MNDFDELERMTAEVRQIGQESKDIFEDAKVRNIHHWRIKIGDIIDKLLLSRESAKKHLNHPDKMVRSATLIILCDEWKMYSDQDFANTCEQIMMHDIDYEVRSSAIYALGKCYENSSNSRICGLLIKCLFDLRLPSEMKLSAYLSLRQVAGSPWPSEADLNDNDLSIPSDVDWNIVDEIRQRLA